MNYAFTLKPQLKQLESQGFRQAKIRFYKSKVNKFASAVFEATNFFVTDIFCEGDGLGKIQPDFAGRMGIGTKRDGHIFLERDLE